MSPKSECEVAVVGAGPYGLAVAAHLKGANIETRVFGEAMSFWSDHMPKGMKLRSSLIASDLADPQGKLSIHAFAERHNKQLTYPVPLEIFISYGKWFQANTTPELDTRKVERIEATGEQFCLRLSDGDSVIARRVVMATGLAQQEFRPTAFAGMSKDLVSHSSEHDDLSHFRGQRVAVVGRGQSACESAALLNAAGAEVELICRGDIHWLGAQSKDGDQPHDWMWRVHELLASKSGVGPFPFNWLVEFPDVVRRLPASIRDPFNAHCLRAGATGWLRPGFEGVTVRAGRRIEAARANGSRIDLQFDHGASVADHVLLATGYHIDISRLGLFAPDLLGRINCANGSPLLRTGFESSVRGLHFVGASSVKSFGPLMRFVAGSHYAARHLTKAVLARRQKRAENDRLVARNAGRQSEAASQT